MTPQPKYKLHNGTITITTPDLMELLHSGYPTAVRIGEAAQAKVKIGKRTLWNVAKVRAFIETVSE